MNPQDCSRRCKRCFRQLPWPSYFGQQSERFFGCRTFTSLLIPTNNQGDRFNLNVIDSLTDITMNQTTSIVSIEVLSAPVRFPSNSDVFSIGTVYSRSTPTGQMAQGQCSSIYPCRAEVVSDLPSSFVTQCPIAPGSSFVYNFGVPDQAGTFWLVFSWHRLSIDIELNYLFIGITLTWAYKCAIFK